MEVKFESLNDAIKALPYARVYQSPFDKKNYFNIEVTNSNGGNYEALKELVKLAEKEGFIYDRYYEMMGLSDYNYTAIMFVENGTVNCSYDQNRVYKNEEFVRIE